MTTPTQLRSALRAARHDLDRARHDLDRTVRLIDDLLAATAPPPVVPPVTEAERLAARIVETWIGTDELADLWNVHPETVRERLRAGAVPRAIRIGTRGPWRVPLSAVTPAPVTA